MHEEGRGEVGGDTSAAEWYRCRSSDWDFPATTSRGGGTGGGGAGIVGAGVSRIW